MARFLLGMCEQNADGRTNGVNLYDAGGHKAERLRP